MVVYLAVSYTLVFMVLVGYITDLWVEGNQTNRLKARRTLVAILGIIAAPITVPVAVIGIFIWLVFQSFGE